MTTKEIALKTIEQLPANASWEDIQERINFVAAVRKGLRELDKGKGIPHKKIKEEFAEEISHKGTKAQRKKIKNSSCFGVLVAENAARGIPQL